MSIYLHFLDRELASSVNANVMQSSIEELMATILVCTSEPLYCSLSLIYETGSIFKNVFDLLFFLIKQSQLLPINSHPTVSEFYETRRIIYSHDRDRYPIYFNEKQSNILCNGSVPILHKRISTTNALRKNIVAISSNQKTFETSTHQNAFLDYDIIRRAIENGLKRIENKAITFTAFSDYFPPERKKADEFFIRRLISDYYSSHYINFLKASIITGIPEFSYYDYLAVDFPLHDYVLLNFFKNKFIKLIPRHFEKNLIHQITISRGSAEHLNFIEIIRKYIKVLFQKFRTTKNFNSNEFITLRNLILEYLSANLSDSKIKIGSDLSNIVDVYKEFSQNLQYSFNALCRLDDEFKQAFKNVSFMENRRVTKILICTATDIESETLYDIAKSKGFSPNVESFASFSAISFGPVKDCEVFFCQSQKGSIGAGSSCLTTYDAIEEIRPNFVLSLGIAFGANDEKQSIGDILVSSQVQCYEPARVGADKIIPRGDRMPADPILLNRCDTAKLTWHGSKVHTGLILSGEKLVDSPEFKKMLLDIEPEAIGGEMEGAGIIAACYRKNVPWVIIKGICDWAENKESDSQSLASLNTFEFFWHILDGEGWKDKRNR